MIRNEIPSLRRFLFTLIDLISQGKKESCSQMEEALASGIATKLYSSYTSAFKNNNFNTDSISEIDEYFKQWSGISDGQEFRKYNCVANDGIELIIKLALNEIF